MAFPFTVNGTVSVPIRADDADFADRLTRDIAAGLESAKAKQVNRDGLIVTFRGGIFRLVSTWNPTYAVSSGTLQFLLDGSHARISYRLRMTEMIVIASIAVLWVLAFPVFSIPELSNVNAGGLLVALWLFIVGSNYLSIHFRFPKWLKRVVEEVKAGGG